VSVMTSSAGGGTEAPAKKRRITLPVVLLAIAGVFVLLSALRIITGVDELSSSGTLRATLVAAVPIGLAGLGGLWSERAGVVNIGLEGMMILGTFGAGYFGYFYGPWQGVLGAILLGAIGGLLHAVATVLFGVDHIVSGVAINIIGLGASRFLAEAYFSNLEGGGVKGIALAGALAGQGQPHDRQRADALATPRLADKTEQLAFIKVKAHSVNCLHQSGARREMSLKI